MVIQAFISKETCYWFTENRDMLKKIIDLWSRGKKNRN